MKKISIGSNVVFYPGMRQIISNNQNLKMHSSASYCFELLIARQGEIVSHEAFYQYAWRRFGMEVSANALYQSISLIRKNLLACDIRQDVIRTIPRRGFMLSNSILIEESTITPEQSVTDEEIVVGEGEQNGENSNAALDQDSKDAFLEKTTKPVIQNGENTLEKLINDTQHSESDSTDNSNNPESATFIISEHVKRYTPSVRHLFVAGLSMMTILVCGFVLMAFSHYRQKMEFVKRFDINGCEIYGNEKADNSLITRIAGEIEMECSERKNIFITAFTNGERISVLQCKNTLSLFSYPNCVSYYYIGRKW